MIDFTNKEKIIPQIGKGQKMSIAKAGLIYFFNSEIEEYDVGVPDPLHSIVDIAGAKHCSWFTPAQVTARLRNSPYFESRTIYGLYKGIRGNWRTSLIKPNEKGTNFYNSNLKNLKK